jgi:hypothetical protein
MSEENKQSKYVCKYHRLVLIYIYLLNNCTTDDEKFIFDETLIEKIIQEWSQSKILSLKYKDNHCVQCQKSVRFISIDMISFN